jgi:hypothetical protein
VHRLFAQILILQIQIHQNHQLVLDHVVGTDSAHKPHSKIVVVLGLLVHVVLQTAQIKIQIMVVRDIHQIEMVKVADLTMTMTVQAVVVLETAILLLRQDLVMV